MVSEETLGKIGKYELVELIGEGAMGKVYRALDPVLGRHVAIKLMSASIANDAHLRDRFLREARAAANLQHPNIITIYDFGETEGHPFIAMEFIEGTDLAHLIETREPLSLDSKVQLVVGLLGGLAYAHTKGVIHRDIKPANIRVTPDGRVKIMDFGIAHLQGSEITHSGAVLGTPDYMAPEQVRGLPVTAATDIFAAGAVFYELLTFEKPFTGETLHAVLFKVVTENPRPIRDINPSLPEHLQRIVDTALHKEPGQRYPTADAMAADLSTVRPSLTNLETLATLRFAHPLNLGLPPREWWKQKRVKYAAGATGAVALLVIGWVAMAGGNGAASSSPPVVVAKTDSTAPNTPPKNTTTKDTAPAPPTPAAAPKSSPAKPRGTPAKAAKRTPAAAKPAAVAPAQRPSPSSGTTVEHGQIEREVQRLERAISSGKSSEIAFLMPGIQKSASKGWDDFFRNKREIHATLRVLTVDVKGDTATAHLDFSYTYTDPKSGEKREQKDLKYTAVLERTGGATWFWKDFK